MTLRNDRNQEATVWIGGLDDQVNESLLWELMIQAGPVKSVNIPRDKITGDHSGYAFCEFASEEDADYAMKIMNMVRLYGKSLKINKASRDRKDTGVGANVFVGNLDPEVDDQLLYNTFSAFGQVLSAKVMYDDDGTSRGFGFVNFADFESSDAAILHMSGQFLCNKSVHVSYAYKKEGTKGEKHGSENERLIAKLQAKTAKRPHMHFSAAAPSFNTNNNNNNNNNTNTNNNTSNNNQQHITNNNNNNNNKNKQIQNNNIILPPNTTNLPPLPSITHNNNNNSTNNQSLKQIPTSNNIQLSQATAQALHAAALMQQAQQIFNQQQIAKLTNPLLKRQTIQQNTILNRVIPPPPPPPTNTTTNTNQQPPWIHNILQHQRLMMSRGIIPQQQQQQWNVHNINRQQPPPPPPPPPGNPPTIQQQQIQQQNKQNNVVKNSKLPDKQPPPPPMPKE